MHIFKYNKLAANDLPRTCVFVNTEKSRVFPHNGHRTSEEQMISQSEDAQDLCGSQAPPTLLPLRLPRTLQLTAQSALARDTSRFIRSSETFLIRAFRVKVKKATRATSTNQTKIKKRRRKNA